MLRFRGLGSAFSVAMAIGVALVTYPHLGAQTRDVTTLASGEFKPLAAGTQTIFTNLGSNNSFNSGSTYCVDGATVTNCGVVGVQTLGARFQAAATLSLANINLALAYSSGTNSVKITLSTDGTSQPGTTLESWTMASLPNSTGTPPLTTVTDTLGLTLNSGQYYWVTVQATANDTGVLWYLNNVGLAGLEYNLGAGWSFSSGSTMPALSVTGSTASGVGMGCTAFVANQPTLRQEGVTEPAGDILLTCTGTLVGAQTGAQTLSLYISGATITSRQLYTGSAPSSIPTEAALLVNDNVTNALVNGASPPVQGFLQNGALVFPNFTLPNNAAPNTFQLRVTNVRLNANSAAAGTFLTGTVLATFPIQNQANLVVGVVVSSLSVGVSSTSTFTQCQSIPTAGSIISTLNIKELVNAAFKSPAVCPGTGCPTSTSNATPGQWYQNGVNSESQTVVNPVPFSWTNPLGAVPGQADFATRIRVNITNIPNGVVVILPVSVANGANGLITATTGGDLGPFAAATGPLSITNTGSVTYQVMTQNGGGIDSFTIPATIFYTGTPNVGTALVSATYAPTSAETSNFIPLFADTSVLTPLLSVVQCETVSGKVTQSGTGLGGVTMTLSGTRSSSTTTDGSGNYSFSGLAAGGNYTVTPSRSGYSFTPPSAAFNSLSGNQTANFSGSVVQGLATQLKFSTQPGDGSVGPFLSPVVVQVLDAGGNLAASSSAAVTLTSSPSNVNVTVAAVNGVATFNNIAFSASGSYNFTATSTGLNSALSNLFVIDPVNGVLVSGQVTVSGVGLGGVTINVTGWQTTSTTTNASGSYSISLGPGGTYTLSASLASYSFSGPVTFSNLSTNQVANFSGIALAGLEFYPVTPCRIADTRLNSGFTGPFGQPSMDAASSRTFPIPFSNCAIPATAAAYSFNFTVVPPAGLAYLTTWPTGQPMPNVSTLNSYTGTVVANAAIVPAGLNGAINVYVSNATDLLFDINGYFAPPTAAGLQFYPVTPCRIADTRAGFGFSGAFGPPSIAAATQRSFPVPSSNCGIPATAAAYSLNFTVVPQGGLAFLSTWPTGQSRPNASTLNSYTGTVVANAAIVPAGQNGAISVYVSNTTDVFFDVNGYFAPPTGSGLQFYPVTPCRIADTRNGSGFSGAFGAPSIAGATQRSFPIPSSSCGIPASVGAYSLNFTVVPPGGLAYLSTFPTGQSIPNVSTLNSFTGTVVANAAIVPAGQSGAVSVYVSNPTDVLFDINGYFSK